MTLNWLPYRNRTTQWKELLLTSDLKRRSHWDSWILKHYDQSLWRRTISFYLDGRTFEHKINSKDCVKVPAARSWRKQNEGLHLDCTAKGKKLKSYDRMTYSFVAISYHAGVVLCKCYHHLNDEFLQSVFKATSPFFGSPQGTKHNMNF